MAEEQRLLMRLDIYESTIVRTSYNHGEPVAICELAPAGVAQALAGATSETVPLPYNALFCGRRGADVVLGVYAVSSIRDLHVDGEPQPFHVPLPMLLWAGCGANYHIFALDICDDDWPDPDTPLYHAPFPNVHSNGRVCFGSVIYPVCTAATIHEALRLFLSSSFNHDIFAGKSCKHPDSIVDLYRGISGYGGYPLEDLVPTGHTLADLMRKEW